MLLLLSSFINREANKSYRVKLPKSFLAVNLSESHTFHKKEDSGIIDEGGNDDKNTDDKFNEDRKLKLR